MKGAFYVIACIVFLTATVLGCGWFGGSTRSVRFGYADEGEMAHLPPLPIEKAKDSDAGDDYELERKRSDEIDDLWERAETAETEGDLKLDRELLRAYIDRTTEDDNVWVVPTNSQTRRNSAFDRLDALSALDRGSSSSRIEKYLAARRLHDAGNFGEETETALRQGESDANLKDNVAYLKAAGLYKRSQFEEAARIFRDLPRRFPGSEKREASIFMAALAVMKTSDAYTPTSGDEAHLHEDEPAKLHPVDIDRAWHDALTTFKRLMAEYPHGRYKNDARGWIAYLLLRKGDRAEALVEYYRLLNDKRDRSAQAEAAFSLDLVRHHATDAEMARVEKELANEPEVALVYAYHSLFNYAVNSNSPYPRYQEVRDSRGNVDAEATERLDGQRNDEWKKQQSLIPRNEQSRILAFSQRLMNTHPDLPFGAGFALRAAQASLELDHHEAALKFARRALQGPIRDDERLQALWTRGQAEQHLRQFSAARKTLNALLQDYPKSNLATKVRERLAMISEDEGDIEGALEQYVALDYRLDVAYFIDVLMTPDQLAKFIEHHPQSAKKNELIYALGIRYLRANRWNDARKMFAQVQAVPDPKIYEGDEYDPKDTSNRSFEEGPPPLTIQMVMHDVQTAKDLERLEREVTQAGGSEAAAEALYQLASYQYEASSLLFYNPVAWNGERYLNMHYLASEGRFRAPNESQTLFAYMQEHDTLARALKIYLEVVDRYPHTRAAQDALYTAAVCHERLADYNNYWRDIYIADLHAGSRMVTYTNVKAAYPNYQLPRGTYGWQPSTRTVNGGPGWAPPPKYVPPPTRMARLKSFTETLLSNALWFWDETLRRWVIFILLVAAVWFTARLARRNRTLLKPKLERIRIDTPKPSVEPHWTMLFEKGPDDLDLRDKAKLFLSERGMEFWELARDATTRPLLVRNIVAHSVLAILLMRLLWFLHFG